MFFPSTRWLRPLVLGVLTLVLSACAGESFGRDEAISALQTTGATSAEASCMADSLLAIQQLDAADPRVERTGETREALVSVSARCVVPEVFSEPMQSGGVEVDVRGISSLPFDPSTGSTSEQSNDVDRRAAAIQRLEGFGRSTDNATCIVDHVLAAYADDLFEDPNFGLGLDPFEASAFAACL